ncbi:MAG: exodeoxyribonuclease VII small subunit [Longimicrobiales bacterium]
MTHTEPEGLEAKIARIETIVARLEGDRLELDDALALFEEGVRHARDAERVLRETELRIDRLVGEADGSVTVEPIPEPPE